MGKKKTHEQFIQEMKEKGNSNVKIIGHYEGWDIKIECQCNNNPEHKWYATPNNLLNGRGCPVCGIEKQAQERMLTNEEFLEKAKENVSPNVNVLEEYKGYREKIKCQCKSNPVHIWFATPANLLKGRGCPYCKNEKVGEMFSITEEEFLKIFNEKGNPDELEIIGHYKNLMNQFQYVVKKIIDMNFMQSLVFYWVLCIVHIVLVIEQIIQIH